MINKTIFNMRTLLIEKKRAITLKEARINSVFEVDEKTYIDAIANHSGDIHYDAQLQQFSLIKKYKISNKDQLRMLILSQPTGIREDQDLLICYDGVERDLKELKSEGWVRVLRNSQKETYLFPVDLSNKKVEVRPDYPAKALTLLQDIWDKEIESIENLKYDTLLIENNLITQTEKEQLIQRQIKRSAINDDQNNEYGGGVRRQRRAKRQMNDHIEIDFLDIL